MDPWTEPQTRQLAHPLLAVPAQGRASQYLLPQSPLDPMKKKGEDKTSQSISGHVSFLRLVTNYHKLGGMKWQKRISLQFRRAKKSEIKVSPGLFPLQALRDDLLHAALPTSRSCGQSLLFLGLLMCNCLFYVCLHMAFIPCVFVFIFPSLFLKGHFHWISDSSESRMISSLHPGLYSICNGSFPK